MKVKKENLAQMNRTEIKMLACVDVAMFHLEKSGFSRPRKIELDGTLAHAHNLIVEGAAERHARS